MLFCALAVPYTMADEWNQATKASSSAVHGVKSSAEAGKDTWHGLTEGTEVVAHYTKRGTQDTVLEIDKLGHDGLKTSEGTTEDFDRNVKKLVVKAENGVDSFRLTDHAAKDAGRDIAKRTEGHQGHRLLRRRRRR